MKTKKMYKYFGMLAVAILFAYSAQSQDKIVHGVVTAFDNVPIYNAVIEVKSTKQEVLTDTAGVFTVYCDPTDVLVINANGFYKKRVRLNEPVRYAAVNLKVKPGQARKFNAVGYGAYVSGDEKLSAVEGMDNDNLDFGSYENVYDIVKNRFAGVEVSDGAIIIRGTKSLNGNNAALVVINGLISDYGTLDGIPTTDIQKIDILKDASSTAAYGSRGANGVVLIETKTGND